MEENELTQRLFRFSVDVIRMLRLLKGGTELLIIKPQLIKSATSAGANYEEAQGAVSKADFGNKVGISLKEIRESNYWIRILRELYNENADVKRLSIESQELKNILGSIHVKVAAKSQK